MISPPIRFGTAVLAIACVLSAQNPAPTPPAPAAPAPAHTAPAAPRTGNLNLDNASLSTVVDLLARQLGITYILDPRVKAGAVTLFTYGESKSMDTRALLDMVLRVNNAALVQTGDVYRIVPMADVARLPITPEQKDAKNIPDDDRLMMNLVFLKYVLADDLLKLLQPFCGEGSQIVSYAPANLLIILDSGRNLRRTMQLVSMFDSDTLMGQRIHLFEIRNGRPTDLARDLDKIFKSISLNEKSSPIRFLPLDRINTLVAIASNPGVFEQVETWLKKLDIAVSSSSGTVDNYVYRVKYGRAEFVGMAIMSLYMGGGMGMMNMMAMMSMMGGGMSGGMGGSMYGSGAGMYGSGMYGSGGGMYGNSMYGNSMYGNSMYGGMSGMYGGGMYGNQMYGSQSYGPGTSNATPSSSGSASSGSGSDQTGSYLSPTMTGTGQRMPHVVPNPMDNTILIQGTREEYESILRLLKQLDVPPRQVLIEAKIIEVDLSGAFSSGLKVYLQNRTSSSKTATWDRTLAASLVPPSTTISAGILIGRTRELMGALSLSENASKVKVLSEPSLIATDSIQASINVGTEVPTLTATSATNLTSSGSSLFANTVTYRNSGVTLNLLARVNPSGVVTMVINQEVSAPIAPSAGSAIQSSSFSKRTISTQVTVEDGDTVALGGVITENSTSSTEGIPVLNRLPVIGAAFGSRSYSKDRTELVVFLTPHVIYDTAQVTDATEELKSTLRGLQKLMK
jgi:general secretion pathway protein D